VYTINTRDQGYLIVYFIKQTALSNYSRYKSYRSECMFWRAKVCMPYCSLEMAVWIVTNPLGVVRVSHSPLHSCIGQWSRIIYRYNIVRQVSSARKPFNQQSVKLANSPFLTLSILSIYLIERVIMYDVVRRQSGNRYMPIKARIFWKFNYLYSYTNIWWKFQIFTVIRFWVKN